MDKRLSKKIGIMILLAMLSGLQLGFAEDQTVNPPNPPFVTSTATSTSTAPSIPNPPFMTSSASSPSSSNPPQLVPSPLSDLEQFKAWLKSNHQPVPAGTPTQTVTTITKTTKTNRTIVDPNSADSLVIASKPLSYSQSQALMLRSAPPSPPPSEDSQAAFNGMMQQNMPLTPQQVVRLKQMIDASQRAASIPATVPPKPVSSTLMINLAPGTTPPAIRLARGYITSLVFVDSTGTPWPIAAYDIGDPKATSIQWDGKSNVLLIQALSAYGDSDLVVRLAGLPTPITLALVLGQRVVDYRTDIHVAGIGPNTKDLPTGTQLPNSANQLLLNVLDGIAPTGSKQLTVTGGDCMAWLLGDTMYLRTRLTVLSPGWVGRMTSPDGMFAYQVQKSSSVLVSQYGKPIELKIGGF